MDGNWFWWGRGWCSPSEFIALCRLEADTLRELCGTEQLLFAYDPDRLWKDLGAPDDGGCNFLTWYPGDAYVDIVGCDDYSIGTGRSDKEARANEEASVRRFRIISKFRENIFHNFPCCRYCNFTSILSDFLVRHISHYIKHNFRVICRCKAEI